MALDGNLVDGGFVMLVPVTVSTLCNYGRRLPLQRRVWRWGAEEKGVPSKASFDDMAILPRVEIIVEWFTTDVVRRRRI